MQSIMVHTFRCFLPFDTGIIPRYIRKSNRGRAFPAAITCYASPISRAAMATQRHRPSPSTVGKATARAVHFTLPVSL